MSSTAGVVVSFKIPILETWVRFPGSALFSKKKLDWSKPKSQFPRERPDLNQGLLDLQLRNALPLSYTPSEKGSKFTSFKRSLYLKLSYNKISYEGAPRFELGTYRPAVDCSTTELYPH